MREKAVRIIVTGMFLIGAQAAYPQKFPDNLSGSTEYWSTFLTWPTATQTKNLSRQWEDLHAEKLSKQDVKNLESILRITDFQLSALEKKDKQFLFKQGHLAIYLSGFNPESTDHSDRAGIWMLTFPDARRYGLVVNENLDERKDVIKSTRAARMYFEDLKKIHGGNAETVFVMGAVNWRKMKAQNIVRVEEDLSVLRFVHRSFDISDDVVAKQVFTEQSFKSAVSTRVLAEIIGQEIQTFRGVNPTLIGDVIPAGVAVKLPRQVDEGLILTQTELADMRRQKRLDSLKNAIKNDIPSPNTHRVVAYRVKSGDVLGRIAEHYDVSISKLKKWNDLRSDRIDINQKLTIYLKKGKEVPSPIIAIEAPKPEVKLAPEEQTSFTIYEVQPGDTLWAISKRFDGVRPEQIMEWNDIGEDLSIGQKLKIKTQ